MKLEDLLNKLIQMGYVKIYGESVKKIIVLDARKDKDITPNMQILCIGDDRVFNISLRDLVSMESGLWQFVCEKGLYNKRRIFNSGLDYCYRIQKIHGDDKDFSPDNINYRLMLSSIQENIEQFLLDNILIPTE